MQFRKVPLARLNISQQAKAYVNQALDSNRLSYGTFTEKFERQFAKLHQRKYAMVSNSGTSSLHVALQALKILNNWDDGDEVLVPAVTFIASSNVVLHNNLKPVFVDIESDFYNIDPKKIEEKISPKTRAIMPVHLFGQSADMIPIMKIAKKYNLKVLEDSCETMFVNYNNQPVGSMGDVAVFSMYVAHIIVTGVGGITTTNDALIATTIKSLMFHGRDNIYLKIEDDDTKDLVKLNSLIERRFQFVHTGHSFRLTELEGALGVAELERKDKIIKDRKRVGKSLTKKLGQFTNFFQLPEVRTGSEHIYMLYPILIKDPRINKEDLLLFLEENGVETRLFFPLLSQPIYKKLFGDIEDQYPISQDIVKRGFIIGSHDSYNTQDIEYIYLLFKQYLNNAKLLER